jgi:lipopolysaccharide/colanic/teichoic acid biosynthesis glycosyltransferase
VRTSRIIPASYFRWKDAVGRCLALVLLVLGLPIMLLTMLAVRLTSPGPAIFRQRRVGRNGAVYMMYKIRSMRQDAEAKSGPVWTTTNDPRITPVGRFIRTLHLDEFPQLINVLKGEMALVGPRPERPEFVERLAEDIPGYIDRLAVRPGITGLAQINLPPDSDLDSVRRKLAVDLRYIRHGSVSLDLRILACTFVRLLGIKGVYAARMFGLDCLQLAEAAVRKSARQRVPDSDFELEDSGIILRDA